MRPLSSLLLHSRQHQGGYRFTPARTSTFLTPKLAQRVYIGENDTQQRVAP